MSVSKLILVGLGIVIVAGIAVFVFRMPVSSLVWYGAFLLCPLIHFFMMKGMHHEDSVKKTKNHLS